MKQHHLPALSATLSVLVGLALYGLGGCAGRGEAPFENKVLGAVDGVPIQQGWLIDRFFEFSNREAFMKSAANETQWLAAETLRLLADERLAESARKIGLEKEEEVKEALERKLEELVVRDYRSHRLYGAIRIEHKEIERFYEANKEDYTRPDKYRFNYIAISKQRRPPLEAMRMAEEVVAKLKAGEDFLEVANEYSDVSPHRKLMPFEVSKGQRLMRAVVLDTLEQLKPGEISTLREDDDYYYIVRLLAVTPGIVAPLQQVEPLVRAELFRRQATRVRDAFRDRMEKSGELKLEINDALLRRRESSGRDIVLAVRDRSGRELLVLTLNDFYLLAQEYTDVRDQVEYLHELAENEMVQRAAAAENFRASEIVAYDAALWTTRYLAEAYLEKRIEDELSISEEEIARHLEENPGVAQTLKQVRAHIIVKRAAVAPEMDRAEKYAAMMHAENETWGVLGRIRNGLDFRVAAKLYSDDPSFRVGGDVGVVFSGPMGRRFDEVAFRMQEGEISQPVELQDGFMLIWVERIFPPEDLPAEEVRRRARERIAFIKREEIRLQEYQKLTEAMSASWNPAVLQETANLIKDMDSDKALVLHRRRYNM